MAKFNKKQIPKELRLTTRQTHSLNLYNNRASYRITEKNSKKEIFAYWRLGFLAHTASTCAYKDLILRYFDSCSIPVRFYMALGHGSIVSTELGNRVENRAQEQFFRRMMNGSGGLACASTFDFGVGPTRLIVLGLVEKKGKAKGEEE